MHSLCRKQQAFSIWCVFWEADLHTTMDAFLLWLSWIDVKLKEHFPVLSSSCGLSWALEWVTCGVLSKSRGVIMHSRDSQHAETAWSAASDEHQQLQETQSLLLRVPKVKG